MSNGRSERRIVKGVSVEIRVQDEPELERMALTENVSAHGARILVERELRPGHYVLVKFAKEGVQSQARIVYCRHVAARKFVVGIELSSRAEMWATPY